MPIPHWSAEEAPCQGATIMSDPSNQAKSIFLAALEGHSPEQWPAFLERACGGDAGLRAEVEKLLHARAELGSFHEAPRSGTTVDAAVGEQPGAAIGRYKLLEQIGEGGFGVVFMAEQQQPVRRRVALKVLKPGMDTRQVVARFEQERQALALMDHPNIARILDGGATDSGRPYFVMELVKGVPVTAFCDQNHLGIRERLDLFVSVCQAVQHAHQKGVIHRDLKPGNVLVTLHDGRPVAKVIDFGIAKATGPQLTDRTLFTHFAQLVGTPLYMAPEQAELSGLDLDTRCDIYSLGVLLYELLTGTTPFEKERFHGAGFDEIRRIIREEEPPKPSTRMSTAGPAAATTSTKRRSDPRKLSRLFRGELDWVVMQALEKDRNRRYESASAFAADVQRYLADEPVLACPPSAGYRLRKLVRRHRGKVTAAVAMLTLLLAGTAVSTWQAVRATQAERETADALVQVTAEQTKTAAALTAARDVLDTLTDDVVQTMFARQPELGETERAFLRKVLGFYQAVTRQLGETAEAKWLRAEGYFKVAFLRALLGEQREAAAGYRQAIDLLGPLAAEHPGVPDYREQLGRAYHNRGILLADLGDEAAAAASFRQGLGIQQQLASEFPRAHRYRWNSAASEADLAKLLGDQKKYADAEAGYHRALGLLEGLQAEGEAEPAVGRLLARARSNLGKVLREQAKFAAAEKSYRLAFDAQQQQLNESPAAPAYRRDLADTCNGLGIVLTELKQPAEAEKVFRQGLDLRKKLVADYPRVFQYRQELAGSYHDLGFFLQQQQKYADAEQAYGEAVNLRKKLVAEAGAVPRYRKELAHNLDHLGMTRFLARRLEEAEAAWRDALVLRRQLAADGPRDPEPQDALAATLIKIATAQNLRGEFADAVLLLEQARVHNQVARAARPEDRGYRLCYLNLLRTLAPSHLFLADHARLATTADELASCGYDPAHDRYVAACFLSNCATLAEKDARLAAAQREELAQGYAARSLELLRQAVALGFRDGAHLKKNPDFQPLRARKALQKGLAELEAKLNQ